MSHFWTNTVCIRWACVFCVLVGLAAFPTVANTLMPSESWERLTIGLSEICFLPADEASPTWVELFNFGQEPVDIAEWSLNDASGQRYMFPKDLASVPPEGIVLVVFQGPPSPPADDKDFDGDNAVTLYCRVEDATTAFRAWIGECALYAGDVAEAERIIDYVPWGEWQATSNWEAASTAHVWSGKYSVFRADPWPGELEMLPGSSMARKVFR